LLSFDPAGTRKIYPETISEVFIISGRLMLDDATHHYSVNNYDKWNKKGQTTGIAAINKPRTNKGDST
jgi:hypothetical protein